MKTYKLKNHWNFKLESRHKEKTVGKSMTVPDESMSIRQILERHARGMPLDPRRGQYSDPQSFDDPDHSEYQNMDMFDIEQTALNAKTQLEQAERMLGEAREAEAKQESGATKEQSEPSEPKRNDAEPKADK